ncbi:hypothetical protein [Brevundimonas variabilis]|uniref:Uncharacterized protein n=1 Tax=Brevundimonas variabilis TaxID=74312 RepID=A0A7W9CK97_9CAUL|nr:hypothetical protein [Brevundimonas variabilis]MBB5747036.1 hypothetical protein [Brevundimonas variabilis]
MAQNLVAERVIGEGGAPRLPVPGAGHIDPKLQGLMQDLAAG